VFGTHLLGICIPPPFWVSVVISYLAVCKTKVGLAPSNAKLLVQIIRARRFSLLYILLEYAYLDQHFVHISRHSSRGVDKG